MLTNPRSLRYDDDHVGRTGTVFETILARHNVASMYPEWCSGTQSAERDQSLRNQ